MKYAAVFDEALCTQDGIDEAVCDRAGSDRNPHKHYSVFQFETDENGALTNVAITPGIHQKEVVDVVSSLTAVGVHFWLPQTIEARISNSIGKSVTLTREKEADDIYYFIDIRDEKNKPVRMLSKLPVTVDNYKVSAALLKEKAAFYNLPFVDKIREVAFDLAKAQQ